MLLNSWLAIDEMIYVLDGNGNGNVHLYVGTANNQDQQIHAFHVGSHVVIQQAGNKVTDAVDC